MRSLYLLFGDEPYLIQSKLDSLVKQLDGHEKETLSGETPPEKIAEALRSTSLFAPNRLLVLKDFRLAGADWLMEAVQHISSGTVLVVTAPDVDRRSKLYKYFQKNGEALEFKSFAPWEQDRVVDWIIKEVKGQGSDIPRENAGLLAEICGSDLGTLTSEISKIITYCGGAKSISKEDISLLAVSGELEAFALVNSLKFRDAKASFLILERSLKEKTDPYSLLGQISHQFRMALMVKSGQKAGGFAALNLSPFYIKRCAEFAKAYDVKELVAIVKKIAKADVSIKTGSQAGVVLPLLVETICNG